MYVFNNEDLSYPVGQELESHEKYKRYANKNYIPIGFAYDSFITEADFHKFLGVPDYKDATKNKDAAKAMLQHLVIESADVDELKQYMVESDSLDLTIPINNLVALRRRDAAFDFIGDTRGFKVRINNPKCDRVYFFSVPNDKGFTAWLNEEKQLKIYRANLGMMAVVVPHGLNEVEFKYFTPGLKLGAILSLIGLILCGIIALCEWRGLKWLHFG